MSEIKVPWGNGELEFSLPEKWNLIQQAEPKLLSAEKDWMLRLAASINQPVAGEPLHQRLKRVKVNDGRVSIIVEDITRHSPLVDILDVLMREISYCNFPTDKIEFVIASGMHPPMTAEEVREKLGPVAEKVAWRCNPWHDENQYVTVGKIDGKPFLIDRQVAMSELRIIVSSVSPHLQAGFGGGYKMFFPGCCEISSIRQLHRFGIKRSGMNQMVGLDSTRNHMRAAIDAAGSLVDKYYGETFSIQYILDGKDLPAFIAAGEPAATHQMVTKHCAVACGILLEQPADILITNAYPRDYDLWQCFKAIPNTCWAARPGGVVICLAHCEAGLNGMQVPDWFKYLSPGVMRKFIRLLGPETITSMVNRLVANIAGDSLWFIRLATRILYRNHLVMVSPALANAGVKFPGLAIFETPKEAFAYARKQLGKGPQRVSIYSAGGISYPVDMRK